MSLKIPPIFIYFIYFFGVLINNNDIVNSFISERLQEWFQEKFKKSCRIEI